MSDFRGLLEGLTDAEIVGVKTLCESSQNYFTRFFFKAMEGNAFRLGRHHPLIDRTIDRVFDGTVWRLLVNEPPGYSKTLQCIIMLAARGFALNPRARFLHSSYNSELVKLNSSAVVDIMGLPEYRIMWGRSLRVDSSSKGLWRTPEGGAFKASSAGGGITGFRAGNMDSLFTGPVDDETAEELETADAEELDDDLDFIAGGGNGNEFSGALLIDDPLKPDDYESVKKRTFVNNRYMGTFRSRLAHERVPIVVSMQRIGRRDFSHHLLTGGGGETFDHLLLPVEISGPAREVGVSDADRTAQLIKAELERYPTEYTHGRLIPAGLEPGPLWEAKHNETQIDVLRKDSRVFAAQYMQDPRDRANATFKPTYFRPFEVRPRTLNVAIMCDPSMGKTGTAARASDRTAMAVVGIDQQGNKFLLDGYCHRMKLSERWTNLRRLWQRWSVSPGVIVCKVGYERYGLQSDLEYFTERMAAEGVIFGIEELNWVREGSQSKEARIERLEPDFKNSRFFLPATIWRPNDDGRHFFWEGKPNGLEYRVAWGKTSAQIVVARQGEAYRVQNSILQRDENNQLYDLTEMLTEELLDFPNALFKDLSDATSRFYDMEMTPAPRSESSEVAALNADLVS